MRLQRRPFPIGSPFRTVATSMTLPGFAKNVLTPREPGARLNLVAIHTHQLSKNLHVDVKGLPKR